MHCRSALFRVTGIVACGLAIALGSGCATTHMKGTPFYTGEYSGRRGPVEERVNFWPLLYYREPALSVLWPIAEKTEDHFAIRPLMSIYGLDDDEPVYNILWPLARFDTKTHHHRIFPFFWGEQYFVGFPLYWHHDDPWGDGGYDGLLPLWSYRSGGKGRYSTHLLWPFLHFKHWTDRNAGWRIWPLVGSYKWPNGNYRFAAWPLGHQWSETDGKSGGSCFAPLYYRSYDRDESLFVSLPYARGKTTDRSWETVLPLYHRRKSATSRGFYSLLYSYGEDDAAEEKWNLAVPLWYSKTTPDSRLVATLAGGYRREGNSRQWMAVPLLAGGRSSDDSGDIWVGGPLAHVGWDGEYGSHHVFPFYYRSRDRQGKSFYSLLWSSGEDTDGSNWQVLLPLMYRHRDADSKTLITPLYAQGTADGGETRWRSIVPLVFNRKTRDEHLVATLLGGYRRRGDDLSWLAYPLLSGGKIRDSGGSFWAAAPLVHARWDERGSAHHVLPLYYRNNWTDTFLSLPVARWKHGDATTTLVPPTVSWLTQRPSRSDLWMLGPLAHLSWGEDATTSHIFPLYYRNTQTDAFASLLAAKWHRDGTDYWLAPPLLSLYSEQGSTKNLYALLGLFHRRWGDDTTASGHLLPLYMYRDNDYFYTLLAGRKRGRDGFVYPLTPLIGIRRGDYAGGWVFPFWSRRRHRESRRVSGTFLWGNYWRDGERCGSGILPIYGYENFGPAPDQQTVSDKASWRRYGKRFWSLPACWYRNETIANRVPNLKTGRTTPHTHRVKKHGFFPLWRYSRKEWVDQARRTVDGSVLLLLYDYKSRMTPARDAEAVSDDYTRARVLWRVWHYERSNGNVSVDMFPAITYDRKQDGFRKVSFLWRFFRYESGPKGTKADLLFVPIVRKDAQ
jgi:hypothetical protein